ncbi:NACHT domain-containing protein [Nonomuraea monospora]
MRRSRLTLLALLTVLGIVAFSVATNQLLTDAQASWSILTGLFAALAAAWASELVWTQSRHPGLSMERLDEVAGKFATQVRNRWQREASAADLSDAGRLPLRWAVSAEAEAGDVTELADTFRSSSTRRLLILGAPGSGKTALALLVLLELLDKRRDDDPVPVMFGISTWDPSTQPFHDWLVGRMLAEYPSLAAMPSGVELARALVARRRVLPLLDGLDELPARQRLLVMDALASTLPEGDPLIITSRDAGFPPLGADRRTDLMLSGLTIALLPLDLTTVLSALRADLPQPPAAGWASLLDRLGDGSADVVVHALSRPWALAVMRRVYPPHDDPTALLDAARFPDAGAIERHLLDRLINTQPAPRPGKRWFSPKDTRRYLAFLAEHMTGDLAWWQLPGAVSALLHYGLGSYFGIGLMLFVAVNVDPRLLLSGWMPSLLLTAAGGLLGGLAAVAGRHRCLGLVPRHHVRGSPAGPRTTLREALASAVAQIVVGGVAAGLLFAFTLSDNEWAASPLLQGALFVACLAGVSLGMSTPGFTYLLAVALLAYRRRIPFRLMTFLEHSAGIGLLRQVGPVHRFRYPHLRDVLVSRHPAETAPGPPGEVAPGPASGQPTLVPPPPSIPPIPPIPPTSKIDAVAQRKICDAAMVQPDVLHIIDDSSENRSHEAVRLLLLRLLAQKFDVVERVATAQRDRYVKAHKRLVDAAHLPWWTRPGLLYLWAAWLSGATTVWAAGMWRSPDAFKATLITALSVCVVLLLIRRWVRAEIWYRTVVVPLTPLFGVGLAVSFFFRVPVHPAAGPPPLLWGSGAVWLVTTLLWLSSAPSMHDRAVLSNPDPAAWLQLPSGLAWYRAAAEQAYQSWIGAMVREGLMPLLHDVVDDERDAMTTVLPPLDSGRLGGLSKVEEFVPTAESRYLQQLITRLTSASIGVSGSRGVGKTTVLQHLCARDQPDGTANLCLTVHAPTAYDAKEFVTHLFIEVCEEVVGEAGAQTAQRRWMARLVRRLPAIVTLAGLVLLAGGLGWGWLGPVMTGMTERPALLVAALGGLMAAWGLLATWQSNRRRPRVTGATASQEAAREHLRSLRYLQAVTRTRTGEVAVPGWSKLGGQWAVQRTEQSRGYPQLVAELRELLGQIALDRQDRKGKIIIGIDELDKIGKAEDAERLLNDLKVIFGVPGCFFLVALSEDALSAFERRSLAFRNTFDSAFDRIVRIPPLRSAESRNLLKGRGVLLPLPYVWLCHALTGGLPRDLLRTALDLSTTASEEDERELPLLADRMIRQDLGAITGAYLRDAAKLTDQHAPAVTEWLAKCATITPLTAAEFDRHAADVPPAVENQPLVVQARAYLHILAALTTIFIECPQTSLTALLAEAQPGSTIDLIAETRLLLTTDPRLARHRIHGIRTQAPFL